MKEFKDLMFENDEYVNVIRRDAKHCKMIFRNNFGVSVINYGYGRKRDLYEVAIIDHEGNLCYNTGIADNVIGFCSELDVTADNLDFGDLSWLEGYVSKDVWADICQNTEV